MVTVNTALAYLKHGWSIIPVHAIVHGQCTCGNEECAAPGKHPRVRWNEYATRRPTKDEVVSWFTDEFPGSNIGAVTGTVSGFLVVDCDGKEGVISAKSSLDLPFPTLVSLTGGGGFHCFYKVNGSPIASKRNLYDKVDLKAEHGFVVLPPSKHVSGYKYRWFRKEPIAEIDLSQFEMDTGDISANERGWYSELLGGVDEGERSNAASKLSGRYAGMGMDMTFLWYGMREWNRHNRPPLPESELKTTVRFVYRKHATEGKPERITKVNEIMHLFEKQVKGGK